MLSKSVKLPKASRHGGAFDRGAADSYYGREKDHHYYTGDTYKSQRISLDSSSDLYWEYEAGYAYNEKYGDKKVWD